MTRKVLFTVIAILAAGTLLLNGQTTAVSASDVIMSGYSAKSFSADPVSDGNLETILRCGMKAPSARNSQPIANINSKKESFGIPAGFRAVAVLRIGNIDKGVDAVSSASPRKTYEEIVSFK